MVKGKMRRLIAMLLAFVLMLGVFPANVRADSENGDESIIDPKDNVFVQMNGENIDSVSMKTDEKLTLTAHATIEGEAEYSWEILVDAETNKWASIYDCENVNIVISYGMLSNFLDENNLCQIRAVVVLDGDTYVSDRVLIEVKQTTDSEKSNIENVSHNISNYSVANYSIETVAEEDDEETVTLTINYLKNTGEQICDPYVATIFKGMHFKTTVLSPSVAGYEPKLNEDDTEVVEEYTFDYDSVSDDVVINIYYYPIEVKYEVRYYFQGIYDDDYTMGGTPVVAYGEVGAEPDASLIGAEFEGFRRVNYQPEVIAADGSTVFQCFYDREYYLIDLDLDGGYGVNSVYAKYGTTFVVNEPKKAGWIFDGWDKNGDGVADVMPSTVPAGNSSYKALWITTETTYTIVYWLENADDVAYSYVGSRQEEATSSTLVSGADDIASGVNLCGLEEHEHSDEEGCYGCNSEIHIHGISCYATSTGYSKASELSGTTLTVYNNLVSKAGSGTEGYVYKYAYRSGWSTTYYNFFYIDNTWYYLGTGTTYCGITLSGSLSNPSRNNYTSVSASECTKGHTHGEDCISCTRDVHTHTDECTIDTSYFKFVEADTNVVVNGDGSTIVNVYYTRKEYTLRFHYARSSGSGENIVYEVVGGTTYPFGALYSSTTENTSIQTLLENVTQWGEVESEPTVKDSVKDKYTIDAVTYGNYTYYYLEFTEKYGSDIGDLWAIDVFNPVKIVGTHSQCDYEYAYFSAWNGEYRVKYTQDHKSSNSGNETIKGCYMYLDENVIFDSKFSDVPYEYSEGKESSLVSFLGFWDNGYEISWSVPELYRYNLMVESLDENDEDGYELYKSFDTYDDSDVANQTATNIKGMTYTGYDYVTISDGSDGSMQEYSINFYYDRNEYELSFYNYNTLVDSETVLYGKSLEDYYFVPEYPTTLEENAYEFAGWYTTAGGYDGSRFDFTNNTMPAENIVLYAKWIPVTHTVTFYNTYQDMVNGGTSLSVVPVSHGEVLESDDVPETENAGYTAGEWFYIKNGEKVAYRPISIAVKDDLKVYRDWSSSVVLEYTVHYYKNGTTEKVAEDSTGWMFDGTTKTFKAKGGGELGELYDDYVDGWYPTVSSTSIVAEKGGNNIVVFYYDYQNPNPYTVKYVDANTGVEIADSKVVSDNEKSVVTEIYKPVDGYMPDAYYKQLVLALNKDGDTDKNTVTFYYSKASNSAYYAVEYYFMNVDGSTYKLNAKIQSPITIGSTANIPELSEDGYLFEKCLVKDGDEDDFEEVTESGMNNIVVNENGALIQVYYERDKTSYTVHYYLSGTETSLKEDKTVDGIYFGTSITEETETSLEGYSLVGESSQTKELVLDSSYNVFTFYYEETLKTANYKVVCGDDRYSDKDFGFVSHTLDVKKWSQSYNEVTATARDGFYFVGWYSDEDLTTLVSTEASILPDSNEDITYYALFEPYLTNLVISKSVDTLVENQTFVFNIKGLDNANADVDITVTVHGGGEIKVCSLLVGNYEITEDIEWSWKYDSVGDASKEVNLVVDESQNRFEFTNSLGNSNLLSGEDYSVNIFN